MMVLNIILLTMVQISMIHSFFHIPSMQTFTPQTTMPEDALFGYSIAYQASTKRLFISAPKADYIGQVFVMDEKGNMSKVSFETGNFNALEKDRHTHELWLGASVRASNSFFVTCAPRYWEMKFRSPKSKENVIMTLGVCFVQAVNADMRLLPILAKNKRISFGTTLEERMDSFSWNIEIGKSDMELLLGSPIHKGHVSVYANPLSRDNPNLIDTTNPKTAVDHNYGYSITTGNFFTNETLFAISTTFGDIGIGKVFFFNKQYNNIHTIISDHVGTMFGAALCTLRLSGNHDSLLIAAPTYAENNYITDAGAVYVYVPDSETMPNRLVFMKIIKGSSNGGYFGSTMINLGDMDGDKKEEVAIAAPYEDEGAGAVYIYSAYGLLSQPTTYRVRIRPEGYRAFGLSLTALQDYENGCNDLSIGAPYSNTVFLLQCMAIVTVNLRAILPSFQFENVDKVENFNMDVCLDVIYPEKPKEIIADIKVTIELSTMYSKLLEGDENGIFVYTVPLNNKIPEYCRKMEVQVKIPNSDFFQVIEYKVTAELLTNPEEIAYDAARVILSERSHLSLRGKEWSSTCGAGKTVCVPELVPEFKKSMGNRYMVGGRERENFSIYVKNKGETAYTACAAVQVLGVNTLQHPDSCVRENTHFICKPRSPLQNGDIWSIQNFELETSTLNSRDKEIKIIYELYNHCGNVSEKHYFEDTVTLFPDPEINITGQTNPNDIINTTALEINTSGKKFDHVYTITNNGKTNWVGMQCEIRFNSSFYIDFDNSSIRAYPEWGVIGCSLGGGINSIFQNIYICNIGDMRPNQKIKVYVTIATSLGSFDVGDEKTNISISTEIYLIDVKDRQVALDLQTILLFQTASVALWIIIVAVVFSLLLLFIIAFVLYECGFLRRKKNDELKTLKADFHRKSMLRESMRGSMIAAATRHTGPTDSLIEQDENEHEHNE